MFAIGLGPWTAGPRCSRSISRSRWSGSRRIADLGIGVPYFVASALGYGAGDVRAVTYEYGNAFLIVAGLLNLLVVIDAYDIAHGPEVMQSHLLLLVLFAFFVSLVFAVIAQGRSARAAPVRRHDVRRVPGRRRSCSAG